MVTIGGTHPIDVNVYLPAGLSANNSLPNTCRNFIYLKVDADLSAIGLPNPTGVFVPCYFPNP